MYALRAPYAAAILLALASTHRVSGADSPITLAAPSGAALTFAETDRGWRWTALMAPNAPDRGWSLTDDDLGVVADNGEDSLAAGWTLVDNAPDQITFEQEAGGAGLRFRRIYSFGAATNAVRIETQVQSSAGDRVLQQVELLRLHVADESFHETGAAPSSFPLFGNQLFVGLEHVSGEARADGDTASLAQSPWLKVGEAWQSIATVVVGWPLPGASALLPGESPVRQAFLQYLDTVRIKPDHIELHTNTWWTLPLPFSESDVLKDIEALRQGFAVETGMFFDSYALDLGWSNPHSVWRADPKRFPYEFHTIADRLGALGCSLGLWISPGSGYPPGLDNAWLKAQGYELTPFPGSPPEVACFALGGRYQQAVKASILDYATRYPLGHVKLDFMLHECDDPAHGHPTGTASSYAIDAGLADILDSLRAVNPRMALEPLVCGYPPSPWWIMHTPFVLGPHGDDVPYGRVPSPEWIESLITARDIAYRSRQEEWIMPTSALETFDIVVQTPGAFENMAVMAVGRGRWFISTYLKPSLMAPADWDFLAGLVRWERANQQFLGNARMFGGKPEDRAPYGYVFHNADKDIYCVRNPWIEERTIQLPAFVDAVDVRDLRMIYPRRTTLSRMKPGVDGPVLTLAPYETVMLETVPIGVRSRARAPQPAALPTAQLSSATSAPRPVVPTKAQYYKEIGALHYVWDGSVDVANLAEAQLCILVEGAPPVSGAACKLTLAGRDTATARITSEGQFGAALDPSPEHWTWFTAPVAAGNSSFHLDLNVPLETASIGVYLRGMAPARNDPEPRSPAVFPVYHPDQRATSQTVLPLTVFTSLPQ